MEIDPEVSKMAASLAGSLARNTAQIVWDKVTALKAKNRDSETIDGLEQIITELIGEKTELIRIAQAYQSELVAQRLSSGDIKYITESVVPLLEQLAASAPNGNPAQTAKLIELVKPILSVETANVLQLLGFNFRKAIGEPLTELVERQILARASATGASAERLKELELERENLIYRVSLDPEAAARLHGFIGRS